MQIIFDSASVASFNHKLDYLGENFNYRNTQQISLRGQLLENAFSGVSGIWSDMSGAINDATDFSEILINGISFGSGVLRSLNFAPGNDVRKKEYSAQVEVFSTGNFYNLTGNYYSGLGGLGAFRLDLVESLREDFTFVKKENETYEYDRSLSMKVLGDSGVQTAKSIASLIYGQSFLMPFVNAFYPNFYLESGRKYRREVYNLEQGEFLFDENFKFQSENPYIWTYVHALSFAEKETSVSEDGVFRLVDTSDSDELNSLFFSGLSGAYGRCNEVYGVYATTGCNLINSPASQRISKNNFIGEVTYSIAYSDNSSNLTGCIWENTINMEKTQNGAYVVSENGFVRGQGTRTYNPNDQYLRALSCYSGIQSGVFGRLSGVFFNTGLFDNCQSGLYLAESSFSESEYDGFIEYTFGYSSNENFNTSGNIDYKEALVSINEPIALFSVHGILNDKQIVSPVYGGNSSLGTYSNSINLIGSGDEFSLTNFTNVATGLISRPSGTDGMFLSELEYTFSPAQKRFSMRADYNYVDYRSLLNILV
jgi:hypothetical protein